MVSGTGPQPTTEEVWVLSSVKDSLHEVPMVRVDFDIAELTNKAAIDLGHCLVINAVIFERANVHSLITT